MSTEPTIVLDICHHMLDGTASRRVTDLVGALHHGSQAVEVDGVAAAVQLDDQVVSVGGALCELVPADAAEAAGRRQHHRRVHQQQLLQGHL